MVVLALLISSAQNVHKFPHLTRFIIQLRRKINKTWPNNFNYENSQHKEFYTFVSIRSPEIDQNPSFDPFH